MFRVTPLKFAALIVTGLIAFTGNASAQTTPAAVATEKPYVPQSGQRGKDVIWLPTPQVVVDKMLEMAKVTPQDVVIDLGSGDGRTVITAARLGARALGIEYNPDMVEYSKRQAAAAGMTGRASFVKADLYETSFADATVLTMFLLPEINRKLRPKILELKPGTRIVSNTFTMAEWKPDAEADLLGQPGCDISFCRVLHWVVPQKVEGTYTVAQGEVTLLQEFQMLTGTLKQGTTVFTLNGRVYGEQIMLSAGDRQYRGRLAGGRLELREL
jgi:SAM-dependent methyltransferase